MMSHASKPLVILGQGSRDIRSCDRHLSIGGFSDRRRVGRGLIYRRPLLERQMPLGSGKSCSQTRLVSRDTMMVADPDPGSASSPLSDMSSYPATSPLRRKAAI